MAIKALVGDIKIFPSLSGVTSFSKEKAKDSLAFVIFVVSACAPTFLSVLSSPHAEIKAMIKVSINIVNNFVFFGKLVVCFTIYTSEFKFIKTIFIISQCYFA